MGTFTVVGGSPVVVLVLAVMKTAEGSSRDEFVLEGSVKTFVFAKGLWVTDSRVREADSQMEEPSSELCIATVATASPWTTIIGKDALRKPVAAKGGLELTLHRIVLLIGTGS